jgi:hypothetical protein
MHKLEPINHTPDSFTVAGLKALFVTLLDNTFFGLSTVSFKQLCEQLITEF